MSDSKFRDPREYSPIEAYDAAYDDAEDRVPDEEDADYARDEAYRADDEAYREGDGAYDGDNAAPEQPKRPSVFARMRGAMRRNADTTISDVIHGRILSTDFFRHHWLAVLGVVAMLMIYITNRYTCQTQMETIQRLQNDLEVAKTERVREKSAYMSRIRESKMQAEVDSLRLGLTVQEQPPYRLSLK